MSLLRVTYKIIEEEAELMRPESIREELHSKHSQGEKVSERMLEEQEMWRKETRSLQKWLKSRVRSSIYVCDFSAFDKLESADPSTPLGTWVQRMKELGNVLYVSRPRFSRQPGWSEIAGCDWLREDVHPAHMLRDDIVEGKASKMRDSLMTFAKASQMEEQMGHYVMVTANKCFYKLLTNLQRFKILERGVWNSTRCEKKCGRNPKRAWYIGHVEEASAVDEVHLLAGFTLRLPRGIMIREGGDYVGGSPLRKRFLIHFEDKTRPLPNEIPASKQTEEEWYDWDTFPDTLVLKDRSGTEKP